MAFFSTLAAIGGLLAGASAVGASVISGLSAAAATAASAVAGGTMSAASAIASGAINAGELVLGEIISAPDLLVSVASEGGSVLSEAGSIISSGASSVSEIMSSVVSLGEDVIPLAKDLIAGGGVSAKDAVMYVAQAGGDASSFGTELLSAGKSSIGDIVGGMKTAGYDATRFIGEKIFDGTISLDTALQSAKTAGLDVGNFATGLVNSGAAGAQEILGAAKSLGESSPAWQYGSSALSAVKNAVSSLMPSAETVGNVASQIVSAPIDAAGALLNAAPGVAGAAQNVAAGGGGGFGTDLLNIGSTLLQGQQAKKAAETQAAGTNRALDILEKSMATTRSDLLKAGETGRADITGGAAGAESALAPFTKTNYLNIANKYLMNPTAALSDPGAAWELEQGRKGLESAATVKSGGGLSGQQMKEASQYAINFASTKTDEALARLAPFLEMQYGASTNIANIRSGAGTSKANLGIRAAGGAAEATASGSQNIASTLKELGNIESQKDISKGITIGNISEYLR